MRRTLPLLIVLTLVAAARRQAPAPAAAQKAAAAPAPTQAQAQLPNAGSYVFHSNSRLVVETVTVTDKNGKPIPGLTKDDFTVTEDNIPQTISVFDYQQLATAPPPPPPPPVSAQAPAGAKPAAPVAGTGIVPETAGDHRYSDRALVVLYFDLTAMQTPEQLRAIDDAKKYIAAKMKPADLFAIMDYEGSDVKVKQPFTSDKEQLDAALDNMTLGILGYDMDTVDAASADTGTAFGQDDSEFNIFTTNRQMAALQTAVNMLSSISEKKSLVYFSSGISMNGLDNQAQLASMENAAIRAGVAIFAVDARGLMAAPPMGNATQGSPGGLSMYNGAGMQAGLDRITHSQDMLYSMASDTGGKALFNMNDLGQGIAQAEAAITDYYIIGYYTTNGALDGKYRRVRITYKGDANAKLAYRVGYYTGKEFAKFTVADKERQLEDALMLGDPITDLSLDLEVDYFDLDSAEYFVPIAVRVPGSELALAKAGGHEKSHIDFIGEVKDEYGTTITNLRDNIDMNLSDETAADISKHPVAISAGVTLLPGKYTIKVLARDDETGRIGTYIASFDVPNLRKVTDRLPISSVVIGSQRQALSQAVYNVKKDVSKDAALTDDPLVENGEQLLPSVYRVFSRSGQMYVFLQAYEYTETTDMQPLVAYVAFYRDGAKVFESAPIDITSGIDPHSHAIPVSMTVPLEKLPPGIYDCEVGVLDPAGNKAAFWQENIRILP